MLAFLNYFNFSIFVIFLVLYSYQFFYAGVSLFLTKKIKPYTATKNHRYAIITAARNEAVVIKELISSVQSQKYPSDLIDIFVVADNCSDETAAVARNAGAIVYERFNNAKVGKGYALDYIFKMIDRDYKEKQYEGYFVFDADNVLDENYICEMNKIFDQGYPVVTSYRNTKNYDSNWISAGYSLWFLRESRYLNQARMLINTNCAISGTGFLLAKAVIDKNHGWKHHLLTEDIEFSVDSAIQGIKIGYCGTAKIYDEQPCTWEQSWKQRLRWSKGFYQVFGKYGVTLLKTMIKRPSFACYDMLMTIAPALFVSLASVLINLSALLVTMATQASPEIINITLSSILASVTNYYLVLYAFGLLTTISEWKEINCSSWHKIFYTFTFPLFIFTYVPISIVALFKKIEWTPITHNIVKSIEDIRN